MSISVFKRLSLFSFIFMFAITLITPVTYAAKLSQEQKNLYDSGIYYYDKGYLQCGSTETVNENVGVSNPNLYLIGDSYSEGLRDSANIGTMLKEKGYSPTINAHVGRSITGGGNSPNAQSGLEALEADKETVKSAGTIVIVLGTNPNEYDTNIPKFMDKLKTINGSSRIFWVNTAHNDPSATEYIKPTNTAIQKYSTTYNYSVIDWHGIYSKDPSLAGGLHPSAKGYKEMAKLIINSIGVPAGSTELNGYKLPAYSGPTGLERIVDPDGIMRGQGGGDEPVAFIDSFKKLSESDKKAFGNHYITMRWRYASWAWDGNSKTVDNEQLNYFSKNLPRVVITNPKNNKSVIVAAIESGPGPSVGTTWRKEHGNKSSPAPPWWQDYKVDAPAEYDGIVSGITKTTMDALGLTEADLGYDANPKAVKLQYSWAPNQSATPGTTATSPGAVTTTSPSATSGQTSTTSTATGANLDALTDIQDKYKKNVPVIWAWLMGKGFTAEQTAGIMGNIYQESKFWPGPDTPGDGAYGLVQWLGGRKTNLIKYIDKLNEKSNGNKIPYNDIESQLNFAWLELNGSYKQKVLDPLKKATTLEEATNIVLHEYEIPGNYEVEEPLRLKWANEVMKAMGGATITPGSPEADACKKSVDISPSPTNGQFVHYSQNVAPWGDLTYPGGGQIKSSGCGLTSYSMIAATLMQDKTITPLTFRNKLVEGGYVLDGYRGLQAAQAGKKIYGLNYNQLDESKSDIRSALKSGALVISGGVYGPYRFGAHIIVLVSIDSNDKVTVSDPEDDTDKFRYYSLDEFIGPGKYFVAVTR